MNTHDCARSEGKMSLPVQPYHPVCFIQVKIRLNRQSTDVYEYSMKVTLHAALLSYVIVCG